MRTLYKVALVAAVLTFVLGVKALVPTPEAEAAVTTRVDVMQMQAAAPALPAQLMQDMTFALE